MVLDGYFRWKKAALYLQPEMGTLKAMSTPPAYMSPSDLPGAVGFQEYLRGWQAMSEAALAGVKATNQAMFAPLEASMAMATGTKRNGSQQHMPSIPSLEYEQDGWTFERTVDDLDEIEVGDSVRFTKELSEEDVEAFAAITGDTNRLHLSEEYAEQTRFGGRIVHGTLVSGMISAALARLPGLTIYLSQVVEFIAPVEIDSSVTAIVEVLEDLGDGQYRLSTIIENEDGEQVVDGEAVVLIEAVED